MLLELKGENIKTVLSGLNIHLSKKSSTGGGWDFFEMFETILLYNTINC